MSLSVTSILGEYSQARLGPSHTSKGRFLALNINIRQGWKLLKVTNAVAYYVTELITTVKCFIVQASKVLESS